MTELTEDEVIDRLWQHTSGWGGQARLAREIGVIPQNIGRTLHGDQRVTPKICAAIGIKAEITKGRYATRKFYEAQNAA